MTNINLIKLGEYMTAKERVKMVVSLNLEGFKNITYEEMLREIKGQGEVVLSTQSEINKLRSSIPNGQVDEFNYYLKVVNHVWKRICKDIESDLDLLLKLNLGFGITKHGISLAPLIQFVYLEAKKLPDGIWVNDYNSKLKEGETFPKMMLPVSEAEGNSENPNFYNSQVDLIRKMTKAMCVFDMKELWDEKLRTLKLNNDGYETALTMFLSGSQSIFKSLRSRIALIREIERKYFDGMELVVYEEDNLIFPVGRVEPTIVQHIIEHNEFIDKIAETFSSLSGNFWKYELDNINEFKLKDISELDDEWIQEQLTDLQHM